MLATSFYKVVSERGLWDDELVKEGNMLWEGIGGIGSGFGAPVIAGTERGKEEAMIRWLMAAEMGIETAQNNVAFVLDQDKTSLRSSQYNTVKAVLNGPKSASLPGVGNSTYLSPRVALTHWTRSAAQRNVDALVKIGDYHYYGIGLENSAADETEQERNGRMEKAAGYYQTAVDTQMSALAMWNLGWMYENGIGVPQDFHLAKRYYDMSHETNKEAYLPVLLSLIKLHMRSVWHTLTGGSQKEKTLLLWGDDHDGDGWYIGKSKAEMKKRLREQARENAAGGEDDADAIDLVEYARRKKDEEAADDGYEDDYGPEDYFDAATRRGRGEDDEDEFSDTMLLVTLCVLVGGLLWIRGRWVEQNRVRQQGEQQEQGNDAAPPPPPPPNPANDVMGIFG